MGAMSIRKGVCGGGAILAAVAVLLVPAAVVASEAPTVRVTQPAVGRVVLDVADATVTVRKEITADRSVVTLTTQTDRLSITTRRGVLSVSGPHGTVSMDVGTAADAERLIVVLQGSEAAARARRLLERVSEGPGTFVGQSVLLTRAILEVGTGSVNALNQHQQWVAERAASLAAKPGRPQGKPFLIRAAWVDPVQKTPGECWDIYSKEAIRIADDFADCTNGLQWYEAHKWAGCSLIYSVRSEGAMAWFISCNGGVPFQG